MQKKFLLIKNADVYSPDHLGKKDVLIFGDKVIHMEDHFDQTRLDMPMDVIDGEGKILVPGYIDQHVHITGAGGEAGFYSRTPEMQVSEIVGNGITTIVGLRGTDGTARDLQSLYAKAKAMEKEGITAYILTGAFSIPVETLTGSVKEDMMLLDSVIGVGEIAVSDRRSSQPTKEEVERVLADAYVAGLLSGKKGYVHFHLGVGPRRLSMLKAIAEEVEFPAHQMIATHVNRDLKLMEDALEFGKMGGIIDITSGIAPEVGFDTSMKPSKAMKYALDAGVPLERITMSSDADGCMAEYDASGSFKRLLQTTVDSLHTEFRDAVLEEKVPMTDALSIITRNVAKAIGVYPAKGEIREEADADLVLLDSDLQIDTVISRGMKAYENGTVLLKGSFEK